jgi:hypothetical protein
MSITINNEGPDTLVPKLHLLPFQVSFSGTARIPNFFTPKATDENAFDGMLKYYGMEVMGDNRGGENNQHNNGKIGDGKVCEASFRGRLLKGVNVKLPKNYAGTYRFFHFFISISFIINYYNI